MPCKDDQIDDSLNFIFMLLYNFTKRSYRKNSFAERFNFSWIQIRKV